MLSLPELSSYAVKAGGLTLGTWGVLLTSLACWADVGSRDLRDLLCFFLHQKNQMAMTMASVSTMPRNVQPSAGIITIMNIARAQIMTPPPIMHNSDIAGHLGVVKGQREEAFCLHLSYVAYIKCSVFS